jgi:MFS family permease
MTHLHYSQAAVNMVAIAAELAMYLPVPIFGYLCDRSGSRYPSIFAGVLFGGGYITAALVYNAGPPEQPAGKSGWPFWTMLCAFVAIGMGTSCMYLASVSTCAKNFGRGPHRGIALAFPIAAFGLSGMWVSQVGSRILYVKNDDGTAGDVDVFKFFIFLGITLLVMGFVGSAALVIVDEGEMIEEAIDQMEQSGLLDQSTFLERLDDDDDPLAYFDEDALSRSMVHRIQTEWEIVKKRKAEEKARKNWLLNAETKRFLSDSTMWWLAAGFFLVTGPGEAYINNMGTIIGTLYSSDTPANVITTPATHVSIIAFTSTISRLFTGTLTDILGPTSDPHQHNRGPNSQSASMASLPSKRFTISRIWFLLIFGVMLSAGQALLASGVIQDHGTRLWAVSSLIGAGYGAVFALTPIIISVVWGVENFATNWGIVATVPAAGAAVWGIVYSSVYEAGANGEPVVGVPEEEVGGLCFGKKCYAPTFWAMAISVWIACGLWIFAWRGPGGWKRRGIAV